MYSFDNTFETAGFCGWNGLSVEKARVHAGCGVEKPGSQVGDSLLRVACVAGEYEGCG